MAALPVTGNVHPVYCQEVERMQGLGPSFTARSVDPSPYRVLAGSSQVLRDAFVPRGLNLQELRRMGEYNQHLIRTVKRETCLPSRSVGTPELFQPGTFRSGLTRR